MFEDSLCSLTLTLDSLPETQMFNLNEKKISYLFKKIVSIKFEKKMTFNYTEINAIRI